MNIQSQQLDRAGVENTPLNDARLRYQHNPSACMIETNLGNLASHCVSAICSGPWANGKEKEKEAFRRIKEVLNPIVERELAYRIPGSHSSGAAGTDLRTSTRQEILSAPLSYAHGAELTIGAKAVGYGFINAYYDPQSEALRTSIAACVEEILKAENAPTLDSICTALKTKLGTCEVDLSNLKPDELCWEAACKEELCETFGDPEELDDPEEGHLLADAIAKKLTPEQVRLLIGPLEELLLQPILNAQIDARINLDREIDRGFFVTGRDLNDLSNLVVSRLGLTT